MRRPLALAALLVCLVAAPAPAGAAEVVRVPRADGIASCRYAISHGPVAVRARYASACRQSALARSAMRPVASAAVSEPGAGYHNPVFGGAAPDPMARRDGKSDYYAYTTGGSFPVLHSTDLVHWSEVAKALPGTRSWVARTGARHPWAPSVLRTSRSCPRTRSPSCYLLYRTGISGQHPERPHCVAVAYSPTPVGPFSDLGPISQRDGRVDAHGRPIGCGDDGGYGNIDGAPFVDVDGRAYLYVSTDFRCDHWTAGDSGLRGEGRGSAPPASPAPSRSARKRTPSSRRSPAAPRRSHGERCLLAPTISVIPLAPDLVHARGPRKPLFAGTPGSWEGQSLSVPVVENPWPTRRRGRYYLFYSGGNWERQYGMGYATARTPLGNPGRRFPAFRKASANPILAETNEVRSPGGGSLTKGPAGRDWMVYHGRSRSYRTDLTLRIDPVEWLPRGHVDVRGPTDTPQSQGP